MEKKQDHIWVDQNITVFLSTPLSPLSYKDQEQADVFIIQAKVLEQVGAGLILEVQKALNQEKKPSLLKVKKIFLPFSKVDYITL